MVVAHDVAVFLVVAVTKIAEARMLRRLGS
jgi:hypothetical protein